MNGLVDYSNSLSFKVDPEEPLAQEAVQVFAFEKEDLVMISWKNLELLTNEYMCEKAGRSGRTLPDRRF